MSGIPGVRNGQTDPGNGQGAVVDTLLIKNNYGVLAFDRTNIFNAERLATLRYLAVPDGQSVFQFRSVREQKDNRICRYIKGPALFNTDLSLDKMIHLTARQTLQFRVNALNFMAPKYNF